MSSFYGRSGPSELLPRSIFLKPLVTGRRVLELGSVAATGGASAVALLRLGARTVTAFDENAVAIERAREELRGQGVSFRAGRTDELPERSFDLVLVDEAARVVEPGVAAALGRLLSPNGHLVVPVRNPAGPSLAALAGADDVPGPGWAEATAALRPLFPSIEVATQQLLVGYVLALVTGREARLDIDSTAGGAPAAYWLLLCGHQPSGLADQALVALPPEPLFEAVGAARAPALAAAVAAVSGENEVRAVATAAEAPVQVDPAGVEEVRAPAPAWRGGTEAAREAPVQAEPAGVEEVRAPAPAWRGVTEAAREVLVQVDPAGVETARLAARTAELEEALAVERRRVEELRRQADHAREGLRERESWVDGLRVEVQDREENETRTQAELRAALTKLARLEPELHAAQENLKRVREQQGVKVRELAAAQQGIAERTQDLRIAEEELERARAYAAEERQARLAAQAVAAEHLAAARAERDRALARRFFKYHGLGNDFVVLDRTRGGGPPSAAEARAICDRRFGVGADGVLTLLPAAEPEGRSQTKWPIFARSACPSTGPASGRDDRWTGLDAHLRMHILNADGSEAEMCGNGIRCVAKHAVDVGLVAGPEVRIVTAGGPKVCTVDLGPEGKVATVTVDMGAPILDRPAIPVAGMGRMVMEAITVGERSFPVTAVSMGNPHAVIFGAPDEATVAFAARYGPALEARTDLFPRKTNVEFAAVGSDGIDVAVWERGSGITLACGTGACAAAVAAVVNGLAPEDRELTMRLPGGSLGITVAPGLARVWMRGPATLVFTGELLG